MHNRNTSLAQFAIPWQKFETYGKADFTNFVRNVVANEAHFGAKATKVQTEILDHYLVNKTANDSNFYLQKYTQLLSDIQFNIPIIWESRIKAQFQWPLFLYLNTYFNEKVFPEQVKVRANFHSNDHNYLFRKENSSVQFNVQDRAIEDFLVRSTVNFVNKGNPSTKEIIWPVTTPEIPMRYLKIKENRPEVADLLMLDRLKFWLTLVETYPTYNIIRGTAHPEYRHQEL
uniref:Carboxylesterase type B domain-containing protein n=1 Tax=Ditylenchus dipsaci TaxID=166011 RepID=A0A915CLW7_9BILA